jgi:hypothetical protein
MCGEIGRVTGKRLAANIKLVRNLNGELNGNSRSVGR